METIKIAHPKLPDRMVEVPAMSYEHHARGGWRIVKPVPEDEILKVEDLPSLPDETPKDGE